MSVFDQFDHNFLPGDHTKRKIHLDEDVYEELESPEEILEKPDVSFRWLYILATIIFVVLVYQLTNLQITKGSFHRLLAEGNRVKSREIKAPRGMILDRNNQELLNNTAAFALQVYPLDLPRGEKDRQAFFEKLSNVSQISISEIKDRITENGILRSDPVVLKDNIDRDTALILETKIIDMPGVSIAKNPIRNYADILGLSPIIGYVGKVTDTDLKNNQNLRSTDEIGKEGIEKIYNDYLTGKNGVNEVEVDSQGKVQRQLAVMAPEPGATVSLTIDAKLEERLTATLANEIQVAGVAAGAAVAIRPKTGEVLAVSSWPTFDNNAFIKGMTSDEYQELMQNPLKPMFNRAISGTYPSGSVIKPIVAVAGLEEGVVTANTTIDDPGEIKVGSWVYPDWKAHGLVDVRKAIAVSCNVYFYAVGGGWDKIKGLGVAKLESWFEKFGFGSKTGIDLPNEANGLVPSPEWKEKTKKETWYLGDTYHMAIGQGDVLVTPLQMAQAAATIANGGELIKPYIVQKITDLKGAVIYEPKIEKKIDLAQEENIQIVREGMRQAVTSGSSTALGDLPVAVAAKTGTAQFGVEEKTHAWMIAFAPYNDPEIAIAVLVEGGGEGYATAGPIVKEVFNWYFSR